MKSCLLIVTACICFLTNSLNAYSWDYLGKLEVGKRPACIFFNTISMEFGGFYVYCAGYDADNNGLMDSGDEPASVWYAPYSIEMITTFVIDTLGFKFKKPYKIIEMDFRNEILPVRPAFYDNKMYLTGLDGLYEITFTQVEYDSVVASKSKILDLKPAAISHGFAKLGSERLYLSMRPNDTDNGSVIVYELNTKTFIDTIPAYPNVQMTLPLDTRDLLILSEGTLGGNNSRLQFVHVGGNLGPEKHYILADTSIGASANHIAHFNYYQNTQLGITCFDSKALKLDKNDLFYNFYTADNEGPRESIEYEGKIYTTAYNGYVYINSYPQTTADSLRAYGKAEGMAVNRYVLAIATPYIEKTYEPINLVQIYISLPASVDNNSVEKHLNIFPNPANESININTDLTGGVIEIISTAGIKVYESQIVNNIDLSGFTAGVYFLKIQSGNNFRINKFTVVK